MRRNADIATSASAQISDSCTSPPLAKMPTTVQSLSRKRDARADARGRRTAAPPCGPRSPRARRARSGAPRRCGPRRGWRRRPAGRRGTARCWGRSRPLRGRSTITTSSARGERAARGVARDRRAALASSVAWSRATPLDSSASEPARSMMTRSGRPVLASVWRKPSAIASTETSTPTTPAMPIDHHQRGAEALRHVRRLISVIWTTWLSQAHQRCPASASTIRSRRARSAGRQPDGEGDADGERRRDEPRCAGSTNSGGKRPPVEPLTTGSSAGRPPPCRCRRPSTSSSSGLGRARAP